MASSDQIGANMADTTARTAMPSKDVPTDGEALPVPMRSKTVDTTHLQLMRGESKLFGATRVLGCGCVYQLEDTIVVSSQRVLFLWRRWCCGMSLASLEESFYLEDLQFVSLVRVMQWIWLWLALVGIFVGALLLAAADASKPKSIYTRSSFSSTVYTSEAGDPGTFSTLVAVGVIFLIAGIVFLVVFVVRHLGRWVAAALLRGVHVSLNFCRKDTGIVDWLGGSWWRPKHSSTRRMIKLPKEQAQAAYNLLNGMVYDKFSLKVDRA